MKKLLVVVLLGFIAIAVGLFSLKQSAEAFLDTPLTISDDSALFAVEQGMGASDVVHAFVKSQWLPGNRKAYFVFRFHPELAELQAGHYRFANGASLRQALNQIVHGDIVQLSVTFIEGWTIRDWRRQLAKAPLLKQNLATMNDAQLMTVLGLPGVHPEGQFFPASYRYNEKIADLDLLKLAQKRMQEELDSVWNERDQNLPYHNAYDALIMASIIEKETGLAAERPQIAGVFVRRLQQNMRLQTDPSVIYGLGESFDGNLHKTDLLTDTPYNSYTRFGLPPTPIAGPGREALKAAVHPAAGTALYFVARGDGGHVFSSTLDEHNLAVRTYQLKAH